MAFIDIKVVLTLCREVKQKINFNIYEPRVLPQSKAMEYNFMALFCFLLVSTVYMLVSYYESSKIQKPRPYYAEYRF